MEFGCSPYKNELKTYSTHPFFDKNRDVIKSHRDLKEFLDHYHKYGADKCYIYTGRGPSKREMHLGHLVPFLAAKELQEALGIRVVIQLTDDEKYLYRSEHPLETYQEFARHNKVQIQKFGFNPDLTDIYINTEDIAKFYPTILRIQHRLNFSQVSSTFGLTSSDSIGKIAFPAYEMAPCDPICLFGPDATNMKCLVICAWDQDPYFRLIRDYAKVLGFSKPALLHLNYIPSLKEGDKMSTTGQNTNATIWLTDDDATIGKKIKKYACSGGSSTKELHEKYGAVIEIDVACTLLKFFLPSQEELDTIISQYKLGRMNTSQVKQRCTEVLQELISSVRG